MKPKRIEEFEPTHWREILVSMHTHPSAHSPEQQAPEQVENICKA